MRRPRQGRAVATVRIGAAFLIARWWLDRCELDRVIWRGVSCTPPLSRKPSRTPSRTPSALSSGVDPDAKMPDNAREFGPRDRLVRVRRRGLLPNFAQRRIAFSYDAALASGRGRGKGVAAGRGKRIRRWGRERSATARSVRDGRRIRPSGADRPPRRHRSQDAGRHGRQRPRHNRLTTGRKTMGAAQWERERFCQKRGQQPKSRPFMSPSTQFGGHRPATVARRELAVDDHGRRARPHRPQRLPHRADGRVPAQEAGVRQRCRWPAAGLEETPASQRAGEPAAPGS